MYVISGSKKERFAQSVHGSAPYRLVVKASQSSIVVGVNYQRATSPNVTPFAQGEADHLRLVDVDVLWINRASEPVCMSNGQSVLPFEFGRSSGIPETSTAIVASICKKVISRSDSIV